MEIKIDTNTMTEADAIALVEMMASLYPVMAVNRMAAEGVSEKDGNIVIGNVTPTLMDVRDDEPRGSDKLVVSAVKSIASGISAAFKENVQAEVARDTPADPDAPRDAAGIAWDARVHTSNQATKQDGTWKRKPGLDDSYYDGIMAELAEAAVTPAPEPETLATTPETPAAQAFAAPATPPPPPAAPAHTFLSNVHLFTRYGIAGEQLMDVLAEVGVENVGALATADAATQTKFAELITAVGKAQ